MTLTNRQKKKSDVEGEEVMLLDYNIKLVMRGVQIAVILYWYLVLKLSSALAVLKKLGMAWGRG